MSLLSVIDNPRQDVDLIGVMRSPLFGFTEQELADIRLVDRKISYYDALLQSRTDFPKVEPFCSGWTFCALLRAYQPVYPPCCGEILRSDPGALGPVRCAAERRTAPEQPADILRAGALV